MGNALAIIYGLILLAAVAIVAFQQPLAIPVLAGIFLVVGLITRRSAHNRKAE